MECDIGWEVHPSGWAQASKHPLLTIPVRIGHRVIMALLDTGSSVSMVRSHLVAEGWHPLRSTAVTWVNCQIQQWLVLQMTLGYDN